MYIGCDTLPNSTCGVGRIELGEGFNIFECLIVNAESYRKPALRRVDLWLDIRCIGSVLVPVLEQIFDFRNQEATCIVELYSALVVQDIFSNKRRDSDLRRVSMLRHLLLLLLADASAE